MINRQTLLVAAAATTGAAALLGGFMFFIYYQRKKRPPPEGTLPEPEPLAADHPTPTVQKKKVKKVRHKLEKIGEQQFKPISRDESQIVEPKLEIQRQKIVPDENQEVQGNGEEASRKVQAAKTEDLPPEDKDSKNNISKDHSRKEIEVVSGEALVEKIVDNTENTNIDLETKAECNGLDVCDQKKIKETDQHQEPAIVSDLEKHTSSEPEKESNQQDKEHFSDHQRANTPIYQFEIPHNLVGLIIGKQGIMVNELSQRTGVSISMKKYHPLKQSVQICSIKGTRENINKCLQLIRRKFPIYKYPHLNLKPIDPTIFGSPPAMPTIEFLSLPKAVPCEAAISSVVSAGHFFLQQPTHPTFPKLHQFGQSFTAFYNQPNMPSVPKPVQPGLVCAAPANNAWYRAFTYTYNEGQDTVLVKYLDYGGYLQVPASQLKQIRSDFLAFPFQAVECYLHNLKPKGHVWSDEATKRFCSLTNGKIVEARLKGYLEAISSVEISVRQPKGEKIDVGAKLVSEGLAEYESSSTLKNKSGNYEYEKENRRHLKLHNGTLSEVF